MEGWHFVMFSIVQVFVHLQSSAAVNVALGKPAYQTDTYQTDAADRAVDGNTSPDLNAGRSCAATKSFNTSWWVNLQQIFLIRSVKIFNRNDCCGNRLTHIELYVGFSERGFQSREGFRPGEVGISHTFDLVTPVYGQWVRITRNPPVDVLTLCEVEVEGVPYSAGNGFHFSVFQGYVHTGTAIDVSKKVGSKLVCASRCSNSSNCISTHYNTATFTCSLFDSLAFKKRTSKLTSVLSTVLP
ncbi:fucolectin-4-like [Dreissena polymorpha]|uniref:fucolectin-4-like n=1 Tax=Dreissena polymorpha TaxID=45954 RepID=UPI0022649C4B|nr:fucolectin-4-like [Dreissena polymorpha]